MKNKLLVILCHLVLFSCKNEENNSKNTYKQDSEMIVSAALLDSVLNYKFLNFYKKEKIPIYVKPIKLMNLKKGFYFRDYRKGHYDMTDTLFIFQDIKSYTPSSSRVQLIIPGRGLYIQFFLIKSKDQWKVVKDSTNMYLT
ncbi:hypothetical protein [Dyadobacter sp. CY356]|uniref:hypothetical protein n=1 Tax=Dyadobacter sp. CY356 TaxID=2906442 RepID=UPI001F232404|nr:hypothetical protein [Dyadobacter sp. CY356]MCF0059422.1 hypothetical protein [Dyadobacter sp. CY356]